jgi:hypothetical protein
MVFLAAVEVYDFIGQSTFLGCVLKILQRTFENIVIVETCQFLTKGYTELEGLCQVAEHITILYPVPRPL